MTTAQLTADCTCPGCRIFDARACIAPLAPMTRPTGLDLDVYLEQQGVSFCQERDSEDEVFVSEFATEMLGYDWVSMSADARERLFNALCQAAKVAFICDTCAGEGCHDCGGARPVQMVRMEPVVGELDMAAE